MRHITAAVAVGAAALLTLTGCVVESPQASETDDPTKQQVTIACGNVEELCESVIAAFTASTGIPANYVRLSGGEILARLESNVGAPVSEFDVWWGGPAETFATAAERDLLVAYDSPVRAEIQDALKDEGGFWTGYNLNPNGICASKSALERIGAKAPTSWADLADPVYAQNVANSHPATAGTGFTFLATVLANNDGDEEATFDFLAEMHPNVLQYTKSGSAPVQMLVRGEVALAVAYASVCERERVVNSNDDIFMIYPSEGVGYEVGATGIVNGTANLAAAQAFIDWSLGQEAFDEYVAVGYNVFPAGLEGGDNGLGQELSEIPVQAKFDPVAAGKIRTQLAERFDSQIAPAPVE